MASSTALIDPSRHDTYNRKEKSLGLLCTNFLSLYNRDGVHTIGLDNAASRLGVERRRIYDIVNVLESVGVLARKAKNKYIWKGFGAISGALQELKEEGLRDNCDAFDGSHEKAKMSDDEDDEETMSNPSIGSQNDKSCPNSSLLKSKKNDNRRGKSLALITQNFVKLFVCHNMELISLDEAARLLFGDHAHNTSIMRTKVRRLYDIANVLSSMNLIEKTHTSDTGKPAFRWLGLKGKTENESTHNSNPKESRKRIFGNNITNISFKRNKVDLLSKGDPNQSNKILNKADGDGWLSQADKSHQNQDSKQSSRGYQFGPFAPAFVPKVSASENSNAKRVHDWDSLASAYRPQYQNQALRELFSHYMEAWKSWYSEMAGKRPIHIS